MDEPKIGLLILQPTPFCNINCSYCYLPDRAVKERMSPETFTKILERLVESPYMGEKISFVWHAGEPLTLPVTYYRKLFALIESFPALAGKVTHSFQTNGIPINEDWCKFFLEYNASVGLSIDGPEFIHDAFRQDRRGRGTLAKTLKGVELLDRLGIRFHVIAVITADSLNFADEIFNFFLEVGVKNLGFNIEEKEGVNESSSLEQGRIDDQVQTFLGRMYQLQRQNDNKVKIREFDRAFRAIALADLERLTGNPWINDQVSPVRILSVDRSGNFSTFSPELLGMKDQTHSDFIFGNVYHDSFASMWQHPAFMKTVAEIGAGVEQCRANCEYFDLCGGGAPSNKFYENESFATTETMYCRYTIQAPIDIALAELEKQLGL